MTEPYVLRMRPHFTPKVWGGRKLESRFHKHLPGEGPYGESWEVADLPEGQSRIDNGPLAGHSLRDVAQTWGERLVGQGNTHFPLLVKILDAQADLSIQVHPDADYVASHPDAASKDESWFILHAEPGGKILFGFDAQYSATDFKSAVSDGTIAEKLQAVPVERGEFYRVEPGTVHAICAGVCLLEIQEPSDTTFRVFDYNRPGMDGKPRALHVEQASLVAKLEPAHSDGVNAAEGIVQAPSYRIERRRVMGELEWNSDGPQVVFVESGRFTLNTVGLDPYQTAVIPAAVTDAKLIGDGWVVAASTGAHIF